MSNTSWMADARCATTNTDPDLFFPSADERHKINEARAVCFRCPVRLDCLRYALAHDEAGVWGGTTDYERVRNPRRRIELLRAVGLG